MRRPPERVAFVFERGFGKEATPLDRDVAQWYADL
jgi:hypothetical protein